MPSNATSPRDATDSIVPARFSRAVRDELCSRTLSPSPSPSPATTDAVETSLKVHLDALLSLARRILRSDDLAWDAVQETLVSLWRQPRPPEHLGAWLRRAVLHRALHIARSGRRRRFHEESCGCLRCLWRETEDPALPVEHADTGRIIADALHDLPPALRTTFELRELLGLSYDEIAVRLDVPPGTVRSRLNRARAALRERLSEVEVW